MAASPDDDQVAFVRRYAGDTPDDDDDERIELCQLSEAAQLVVAKQPLRNGDLASSAAAANDASSAADAGAAPPIANGLTAMDDEPGDERFRSEDDDEQPMSSSSGTSLRPSKAQVLRYFCGAHQFSVRRVGHDLQITDADSFPLFDAYVDADCCGRRWTLEAYGRPVLVMHEPIGTWCQDFARPRIVVRDWNGEFFGVLLPGDPFYLHTADRKTSAKIVPHRTDDALAVTSGKAIANGQPANAAANAATANANANAANTAVASPAVKSRISCWLCVHEGSGRHIARVEDLQSIQFNKDVAFQLKLLTLAGIVRLISQSQLTPAFNCVAAVKTLLNCCAGY